MERDTGIDVKVQREVATPVSFRQSDGKDSLDVFFAPKSVAVIGATDKAGGVGKTIMSNLVGQAFGGAVYAVNPNRRHVLGLHAYPNIRSVPEPIELAVIVTPAVSVPGIVQECVDAGVRAAIIISAGFKEVGEQGRALEEQILEIARGGNLRIIGPNCLGLMNPIREFNATFASACALKGNVGFISQSGALCTAILDWSLSVKVGFSAFISIGSMLDVSWGDLIYWLGDDPNTKSIVIYMESIGDAHSFLSAAREIALVKPIIVLKAGKSEGAAKAAASHTGALTGSTDVLDAAFRRSGVLQVQSIESLFYLAEVLGKQPRPRGRQLTIVTNAGGPGVLATDALLLDGGKLAELSPETFEGLNALLPPHWSRNNPIDVLGDATPDRYASAVALASKNPNSDGTLVILTPQAMTDPTRTAELVAAIDRDKGKPILASWMGGPAVAAGDAVLNRANIPTFDYPDTAAKVFNYMWRYQYALQELYETPSLPKDGDEFGPDQDRVRKIIGSARAEGRTLLTEIESKGILAAYRIPVVPTRIAKQCAEAMQHADAFGYPVVLKLYSHTITHKSDVGGVQLNVQDSAGVREAFEAIRASVTAKAGAEQFDGVTVQPMVCAKGFELIVGSTSDPQFGPVLLFGAGGQLVEIFKDRSLGLPPLNSTLARRMMEQTRIYEALKGVRGQQPIDMSALEALLVRFSQLVSEQRYIREIDINPLIVSHNEIVALDARVLLHDGALPIEKLPTTAIRPYPREYAMQATAKDGTPIIIRPIRPEDEPLMVEFHKTLSADTVHFRYFGTISLNQRIQHERLTRMCFIDYDRAMALVALKNGAGSSELRGIARYTRLHASNDVEFAIVISDSAQHNGLGMLLMQRLIEIARSEKIHHMIGIVLPDNRAMLHICQKLGFSETRSPGEPVTTKLTLSST